MVPSQEDQVDRRSLLASPVGFLSVTAALANPPQSLRSRITGFWLLAEAVTIRGDEVLPWLGRRSPTTGFIVFLDNGWMTVQIAGSRPDNVSRAEFPKLSSAEKLAFFEQYYAYYGMFEVDETTETVQFSVTDSLFPFERDDVLKRRVQLEGQTLTLLTEPREEGGNSHFNRLVWTKGA